MLLKFELRLDCHEQELADKPQGKESNGNIPLGNVAEVDKKGDADDCSKAVVPNEKLK